MASKEAYAEMVGRFRNLLKTRKKISEPAKSAKPVKKKKQVKKEKTWLEKLSKNVKDNLATEDKKRQLRKSISEADIKKLRGK